MYRYVIEVAYVGAGYSGFQRQQNGVTIQSEVERALALVFQREFLLTGSSRTDSGVNAKQNFFHFDSPMKLDLRRAYNINAVLPPSIAVTNFFPVKPHIHVRFDAIYREYEYHIYSRKNPFLDRFAYYYPFQLDIHLMEMAAALVKTNTAFVAFSKRNTQVKTYNCLIYDSKWEVFPDRMVYTIRGNRFLRGMVRGLVGTMLQVGRKKMTLDEFESLLHNTTRSQADFSPPGHGLFLAKVGYPEGIFNV